MSRAACPKFAALLIAGAVFVSPAAQAANWTGVCEDVFVPDYPAKGDPGTPFDGLRVMPPNMITKSADDCAKRASGFMADKKVILADARMRAFGGDRKLLPLLRKLAQNGVQEANLLLYTVYSATHPISPVSPDAKILPRAEVDNALHTAAQAGHPGAIYQLARGYMLGSVVKRDWSAARIWLERAIASYQSHSDQDSAAEAMLDLASLYQDDPASTDEERRRLPSLVSEISKSRSLEGYAKWIEIRGRRLGIGWTGDPAAARAMAETPGLMDRIPPVKAEYLELLKSSTESADRMKVLELLEQAKPSSSRSFDTLAGVMLYSGAPAGRDRQRSLAFLQTMAGYAQEGAIDSANRIVESGYQAKVSTAMLRRLYEAVDLKLPGADVALVTLRRSHNSDAEDSEEAAGLEVLLANHSDEMALHTLSRAAEAGPQSYFVPFDTKAAAVAALEKYVAAGNPAARRIRAVAMRRGTLYPQDDVGATKELIAAAEGGDVTAMDLLADAYGDGTGVTENNDEEFRWKKAAAKAGSVEAARDLIFFMPFRSAYKGFSVHDSLVTGLVLYADKLSFYDLPMGYNSVFASRDIEDLGLDYIARGIMDGFRASMAARNDEFAVRLFKKIPKDVKLAVESILSQDGYLKTTPDGFMGPHARAALIAWAREKGLPDMEADQRAETAVAEADARLTGVPTVPDDLMNLLRDKAFTGAKAAKTKKDREMAIKLMALLAQYGDLQPRIAILTNYSGSKTVRDVVVPGLAVLYGLDILLTQPSDYDKAEIDFIFTVTELAKAGQIATAADVVLLALRDDPRMRDPDNLERIAGQFIFAPELCEALATQAEKAKVEGVEKDGCSGASRRALIAWAKTKGPAGDEAAARKRAADVMLTVPH